MFGPYFIKNENIGTKMWIPGPTRSAILHPRPNSAFEQHINQHQPPLCHNCIPI